jgi:type II secretory pathway pseudopilin PulG
VPAKLDEDQDLGHGSDRRPRVEGGYALIGLLIVVVILGVLATIVLSSSHGSTGPGSAANTSLGPTTTTPQSMASGARQAAVSACEVDFHSVDTALETYQALNGVPAPPGTAWATSSSYGGPFMQSWPSGAPNFSITWNGSTLSVVPAQGTASHGSYGTRSPATGCFAP